MTSSRKSSKKIMMLAMILAASVFSSSASGSAVFVSGDVSGVWNADTVVVTDSISVIPGETLVIEPGVDVLFLGYYKFEVTDGAVLHAIGTEADPIRFIPFSEGDRSLGLDFINASNESVLEHCHISDALTSGVHLDNSDITVRNCLIENSEAPTGSIGGGGIEILNGSNALIEHNIIRDNHSADYGGGIYCSQSSPVIRNNIISGNIAGYYGDAAGGGIALLNGSNSQILDNTIRDNSVYPSGQFTVNPGVGGGIYVSGGYNVLIGNNIISDNLVNAEPQTRSNGGGIYASSSDLIITGNVITGNEAEGDNGGGLFLYNSNSDIINNTIAYNTAGDSGGGAYFENSNPILVNSILYFNQASYGGQIFESNAYVAVSYSDVEGGWSGIGNLDVDPLFRDPQSDDFHLQDSQNCGDEGYSPLIDAGSPEYSDIVLDCSRGLGTELSDMGAYGGGELLPVSVDDNTVDTPSEYFIAHNYPNPFNATTTISYVLAQDSDVRIDIYDELGRKVRTLVEARQSAGEHNVTWNAADVATGMYFYTIRGNDFTQTNKMLLLK
jgi:hypothetical protein